MRRALILMALVTAMLAARPHAADACGMASQYRVLPLGTVGKRVIAFEIDQFRMWKMDERKHLPNRTVWQVKTRLVSLVPGEEPKPIATFPEQEVDDKTYVVDLLPTFRKAARMAERLPRFRPATLERRTECGVRTSCGDVSVATAEGTFPEVRLRVRGKLHRASAVFPTGFLAHRNPFSFTEAERTSPDAAKLLGKYPAIGLGWSLGSVRIYRAGTRWLAVYDLAKGDTRFMARPDEPTATHHNEPATELLYHEPVAHHGHNYDVVAPLR